MVLFLVLVLTDQNPNWQLRLKIIAVVGLLALITNTFPLEEIFLSRLECAVCLGWCAIFCITLRFCGILSHSKRRLAFNTIIEFLVLGVLALFQSPLTFPIYMSLKALISLTIYVIEVVNIRRVGLQTIDLRYLLFFINAPCHSMIVVGGVPVHATMAPARQPGDVVLPEVIPGGQLIPQRHHDAEVSSKALYNTCVGISISQFSNAILQALSGCGKCHDWSTVAACVLSQHRFLTYSIIAHARWGSWLLLFNVMMYKLWGVESRGRPFCDIGFICTLGFDMYNIFTFDSNLEKSAEVNKVALIHHEYKVFAQIVAVHLYHKYASVSWANNGLFLYYGISMLSAACVWIVPLF